MGNNMHELATQYYLDIDGLDDIITDSISGMEIIEEYYSVKQGAFNDSVSLLNKNKVLPNIGFTFNLTTQYSIFEWFDEKHPGRRSMNVQYRNNLGDVIEEWNFYGVFPISVTIPSMNAHSSTLIQVSVLLGVERAERVAKLEEEEKKPVLRYEKDIRQDDEAFSDDFEEGENGQSELSVDGGASSLDVPSSTGGVPNVPSSPGVPSSTGGVPNVPSSPSVPSSPGVPNVPSSSGSNSVDNELLSKSVLLKDKKASDLSSSASADAMNALSSKVNGV